jgi:hypothetical protein
MPDLGWQFFLCLASNWFKSSYLDPPNWFKSSDLDPLLSQLVQVFRLGPTQLVQVFRLGPTTMQSSDCSRGSFLIVSQRLSLELSMILKPFNYLTWGKAIPLKSHQLVVQYFRHNLEHCCKDNLLVIALYLL